MHTANGTLHITTADENNHQTTLYTIPRFRALSANSTMRITSPTDEEDLRASITTHSSTNKEDSWIEIRTLPRPPHIPFSSSSNPPAYTQTDNQDRKSSGGHTIKFHRDGSALKRRHRMTLSNGRSYILRGKHSTNFLMCWGNLKIVEEGQEKKSVAEFKVEWPTSFHKFGTVRFMGDGVGEGVEREMLFAMIGVANKEYVKAMACMVVT
ncbi:MAG: hypothetical protein Q9219_007616 [cf. Caloplaca sp. 3 TL-2023]